MILLSNSLEVTVRNIRNMYATRRIKKNFIYIYKKIILIYHTTTAVQLDLPENRKCLRFPSRLIHPRLRQSRKELPIGQIRKRLPSCIIILRVVLRLLKPFGTIHLRQNSRSGFLNVALLAHTMLAQSSHSKELGGLAGQPSGVPKLGVIWMETIK